MCVCVHVRVCACASVCVFMCFLTLSSVSGVVSRKEPFLARQMACVCVSVCVCVYVACVCMLCV
jgi:hypothetical protein